MCIAVCLYPPHACGAIVFPMSKGWIAIVERYSALGTDSACYTAFTEKTIATSSAANVV